MKNKGLRERHRRHPAARQIALPACENLPGQQLRGRKKPVYAQEMPVSNRRGTIRLIGWDIATTQDADGQPSGFVMSGEDLTDQREAERQLLQAQKMQAVGELTGGLAHDFNNLLMAVQGNIEFLNERLVEGSDEARYANTALKAVGRGADLTRRLLAFSRKQLLQPEPTSINDLIADMSRLLARTLGTGVKVETDLSEGLQPIMVDPALLENALLNLAINARDAMDGDGIVRIESAIRTIEGGFGGQSVVLQPGDYIMVAVHDGGCGMSPDVLERVYEPFFSTKDSASGSGLGLSMVYGFVNQSSGHIDIQSVEGEGTSVYLYLPCGDASTDAIAVSADPMEDIRGGEETILVVEDDYAVQDVIVHGLRQLGYQVHHAENGRTAKQMMRDGLRPQLLLTDIIQPQGINGIELADDTTAFDPDCAVLLMSGFSNEIYDLGSDQALPYPLMTKPFRHADLARRVRELLDDRIGTDITGKTRL